MPFATINKIHLSDKSFSIVKKILQRNNDIKNISDLIETISNTKQFTCIICCVDDICILLKPCNHAMLCKDCYNKYSVSNNKCPICMNYIDDSEYIYIS